MDDTKKRAVALPKIAPDEDKVKELIVLLSEMSEGDEYFGATKLNKLLFFTDFLAYIQYGKPVSGFMYKAMPEGPMLTDFYKLRDELAESLDISVASRNFGGHRQDKTLALRNADPSKFSGEEMSIISHVVEEFRGHSASQISALSHEFLGWKAVDIGEEIPYEIALVSTADLTQDEWAFPEGLKIDFGVLGINEAEVVAHDAQNL